MGEKRLEDLAALQAQLQAMDELQTAKETMQKLKNKCNYPKDLSKIKKPILKADALKAAYNSEIKDLQEDLSYLTKSLSKPYDASTLYGISFLLALATGIVTFLLIKNINFNYFLRLGFPVVVFIVIMGIAILIDNNLSRKHKENIQSAIEACKQSIKEKQTQLKVELAKVEEEDNAATQQYKAQYQGVIDAAKAKYMPLIEAKEKEIIALTTNYEKVAVIPSFTYSDRNELNKIIGVLKECYAESISEARRWLKDEAEKKEREAENRRRQRIEEERRRQEERKKKEEERKRNSPGTVVVYATEDNKGKNADIYVDGGYYGAISFSTGFASIQLPAGQHNVSVIIHSQGYRFQSGVESFYLNGGEQIHLKFAICGYNNIRCYRS